MKNVTLAIDEDLVRRARAIAEKRHTTLNALVRSLLTQEVEQEARIEWARAGMRELMEQSTLQFDPGINVKELSRSHDPDELHGHQHSDLGRRGGRK